MILPDLTGVNSQINLRYKNLSSSWSLENKCGTKYG
jgi:hypothetical protein